MMELEGQLDYAVAVEYVITEDANAIYSALPGWYHSINKLIKRMS